MKILLLFIASTVACASPNFTTNSNVEVICQDSNYCYTKYEVEVIIDTFISLTGNPSKAAKHFSEDNLLVIIKPEEVIGETLKGQDKDGNYNMATNNITIGYYDCISYGALGHELTHFYFTTIFNINDHSNTDHFMDSCGGFRECEIRTLEGRIMIATWKELCK